jgi:hypothetical protein
VITGMCLSAVSFSMVSFHGRISMKMAISRQGIS